MTDFSDLGGKIVQGVENLVTTGDTSGNPAQTMKDAQAAVQDQEAEQQRQDWLYQNHPDIYKKAHPVQYGIRKSNDFLTNAIVGPTVEHMDPAIRAGAEPKVRGLVDAGLRAYGVPTGKAPESGVMQGTVPMGPGLDTEEIEAIGGRTVQHAPIKGYHGTTAPTDFQTFETTGRPMVEDEYGESHPTTSGSGPDPTSYLGAHFAKEPEVANKFAMKSQPWMRSRYDIGEGEPGAAGPRVIPVNLHLKNPIDFGSESNMRDFLYSGDISRSYGGEELLNEAMKADGIEVPEEGEEDAQKWLEKYDSDPDFRAEQNRWIFEQHHPADEEENDMHDAAADLASQAREKLRAAGHDGAIYKNEVEGGTGYVAFEPHQIKSAYEQPGPEPSARAGKITDSADRLAGNQPWQTQQLEGEIQRVGGLLRDPRLTPEEREIAETQLQSYRQMAGQEGAEGNLGPVLAERKPASVAESTGGARAGKITESADRLAQNPAWQKQNVDSEIQRLEKVMRDRNSTAEERSIANSQLKAYREGNQPDYRSIGQQLGIEHRGNMAGVEGVHPGLAIYQDPVSGTSIAVKLDQFSPEKLKEHLDAARERMGVKPTSESTVAAGGSGALSSEELSRPEIFVKYSKSGAPTFLGKQPDATLKNGEAVIAVNKKTGGMRVQNTNGISDSAALEKFGAHAKEHYAAQ